jgi:hypothetical protein
MYILNGWRDKRGRSADVGIKHRTFTGIAQWTFQYRTRVFSDARIASKHAANAHVPFAPSHGCMRVPHIVDTAAFTLNIRRSVAKTTT